MGFLKKVILLLLMVKAVGFHFAGAAFQQDLSQKHQKSTILTIYPNNLGLVQDLREVSIVEGDTRLLIYDIASKFKEESLLICSLDETSLVFKEQSFHSDPLTAQNLLEKSIGQLIKLTDKNAITKEEKVVSVRLLAVTGKVALVEFKDRIEVVSSDRIAFSTIPPSLSLHPVLSIRVQSPKEKVQRLELTYLTTGLSWEAHYTVDILPQSNDLNIKGWITLENKSGVTFKHAKILLATPVNSISRFHTYSDSPYYEPHTYPLPFPVTLYEGTVKNVSFLSASNVPVTRNYRIYLPHDVQTNREGALLSLPVQTWLSLVNKEANGLGILLPAGEIKVYARNKEGGPFYIGETKTDHIPIQGSISFPLGMSSKIKAETQQTDFRQLGEKVLESAYRVDLTNPTNLPVSVLLVQKIKGSWSLFRESHPPQSADNNEIKWYITIPGHQTISLRYRIRLTDWEE